MLKSIGFKSVGIPGVGFDARAGVVPNKLGQVRAGQQAGAAGVRALLEQRGVQVRLPGCWTACLAAYVTCRCAL